MPFRNQLPRTIQLGLLVHFPIKQNELNHAIILSWPNRFDCPDLTQIDIIVVLQQAIEHNVVYPHIRIIACIHDTVAGLVSVAFDYPNTLISLTFNDRCQLSFVEDIDLVQVNHRCQVIPLRALFRTILSLNFHRLSSMTCHALFQTILTSIDVHVMQQCHVNYIDVLTCDSCLLEIVRCFLLDVYINQQFIVDGTRSTFKWNEHQSISVEFLSYVLCERYSRLKPYLSQHGWTSIKRFDLILLKYLCRLIIRRSTQMLSCIIMSLADRYNEEHLTIAIDSYLYRSCSIYRIYMHDQMQTLCQQSNVTFDFVVPIHKSYVSNMKEYSRSICCHCHVSSSVQQLSWAYKRHKRH
jgi:hexokinase